MSWRGLDVDDYLMLVASVSETEKTLNAAVAAAGGAPLRYRLLIGSPGLVYHYYSHTEPYGAR